MRNVRTGWWWVVLAVGATIVAPWQAPHAVPTDAERARSAAASTSALGGTERYLCHVSTDKPMYRPGEMAYLRAVVLEAWSHRPPATGLNAAITLKGPQGETVMSGQVHGQDGSFGFGWLIPEGQAGGEYTVVVQVPQLGIPPAERKLDVRVYRAPRLKSQILFARDGYGPGDEVAATLHTERAEGGIPRDAKVTVTARVDDAEVFRSTIRVDEAGNATTRFSLPASIARGDGTLAMAVEDGGVVETATKTLPILLQTVDLTLYPEGGELVAGLPSRLYLEARTPAKKPADIEAVIHDESGQEAARCRTEHEGRGRCELTPARGRRYTLSIAAPAGIRTRYDLPPVKDDGAVIATASDIIGRGEPAHLRVGTTRPGKLTLTLRQREREVASTEIEVGKSRPFGRGPKPGALFDVTMPLPPNVDGVLIATLWDDKGAPLAERLVFRAPAATLKIRLATDRQRYEPGATAAVEVITTDEQGKPVSAVVGLTVTDDSVLEMIEKREQAPRLPVMVYLEPEVRELADAHVYLDPAHPKAPLAVDLLLGTQGWRRFALVDLQRFRATHGEAAQRVLAVRTPPPEPEPMMADEALPLAMAGGAAAQDEKRAALPRGRPAMRAAPPAMMKADAEAPRDAAPPAIARPAGAPIRPGRLEAPIAAPADRMAQRRRRPASRPSAGGFAYIREYAHAVRSDRQPQDRVDFTETLYFAAGVRTDSASGKATVRFGLSDAVTSFRIAADGYSDAGTLGAATLALESVQPFYLEPKLPLLATSGDRVDIPVALVNNTAARLADARLEVRVPGGLRMDGGTATVALAPGRRGRALVSIDTSGFVGKAELSFAGRAGNYTDTVTRTFEVRPRGFPTTVAHGGILDAGGRAQFTVDIPQSLVQGSLTSEIVFYPTPLASLTQALARLLQEPSGCFEQTSSTTYPVTMAQQYFTTHSGVDPALVTRAGEILERGYKRLTSFECREQGYEWFGGTAPGHEALTAYGLMQFGDMRRAKLPLVDTGMVERTRRWLLARRDGKGGFLRNQRALDSFGGAPAETTDAYIVWALLESGERGLDKEIAAVTELARRSTDSYVVALGANVAARHGDGETARLLMKKLAAKQSDTGAVAEAVTSITRSGGQALAIETTGLATLAWLREPAFASAAERAIRFLAQSCEGGRFGSTQATILALKAIVAYDAARSATKAGGSLQAWIDGRPVGSPTVFGPTSEEAIALPSLIATLTPGRHTLELRMTRGTRMPFSLAVRYSAPTPASAEGKLTLATKLASGQVREGEVVELRVDVANTSAIAAASPVAIAGVPAGLEVRHDQLKELVKSGRIAAYEVLGTDVVLYWRQLRAGESISLPVSLVAAIPGRFTAPASRVYEYYTDENKRWVAGTSVEVRPSGD